MKTGPSAMPALGAAPGAAQDDFRLEDFLPYQLSVAANRVSRLFSRSYSRAFGLTIPEWRVLATIARFHSVSPTAVGEWTAMDKVKVSRAAAGLAARGLIRQSPDPKDGRGRLLRMTRKGETVHHGVVPLACALETTLAEGMGRAQWEALRKALVRLNAHVRSIEGPDHGEAVD
ncbi:MAG TPA: MarR family winged helix-turn-helix transcriptional regulator [Acetobacteraceae bacterium]|nr:MarR family winged helix-turn-helix transcriptional regulator [Acetobacteraceae bacterium]